jgi:hypothetical protein
LTAFLSPKNAADLESSSAPVVSPSASRALARRWYALALTAGDSCVDADADVVVVVVVADVKDVKDDEDDSWLVEMRHSSPSPTVSSSLPSLLQSLP